MELLNNIHVIHPTKGKVTVSIEVHGRNGTMSPELDIVIYRGRRIVPYEFRIKGWKYDINCLFRRVYSKHISEIIPSYNPFLSMIPKSLYNTPVILGLEHGVSFSVSKVTY